MSHCTRRASLVSCVLVIGLASAALAQNPLPELFQQGQQQFRAGDYQDSLAAFEQLEELSRQPGLENDRRQLIAPIHFFRAANLAMLGRTQEAVVQFEGFLHHNPEATLEKGSFPKPVIAALDKARRRMRGGGGDIAGVYAAYRSITPPAPLSVTRAWGSSPVRQLMTPEERRRWKELSSDAERQQFVEAFWKQRDPTPDTGVNELRQELETRIRFAEDQWSTEENRGAETDRALVFAILGPPSFINVSQVEKEEDAIEVLRNEAPTDSVTGGAMQTPGPDRSTLRHDLNRGRRETWTYREDRVPDYIRMRELEFEFQTREGYGVGVLNREGRSLFALGTVAQHANETGDLN